MQTLHEVDRLPRFQAIDDSIQCVRSDKILIAIDWFNIVVINHAQTAENSVLWKEVIQRPLWNTTKDPKAYNGLYEWNKRTIQLSCWSFVVSHSRHNCPTNPEVTHAGETVGEQRVKGASIFGQYRPHPHHTPYPLKAIWRARMHWYANASNLCAVRIGIHHIYGQGSIQNG